MTSPRAKAIRTLFAVAGIAGMTAAGTGAASAQSQQQQPPQGWFKACTNQEDVDLCNVQNILVADSGQLLTGVSLIEVEGKVNRKVFQITVPSGRMIPPGVGMQVDGGQTQKIDYAICLPDRCIAEAPLTDQLVNTFKRGSELTLTSVNFQNKPNPIKVTLSGFTDAYEGDPLPQASIEDRKQKLQDFVDKNNEAFTDKLREAQERAKQSQ